MLRIANCFDSLSRSGHRGLLRPLALSFLLGSVIFWPPTLSGDTFPEVPTLDLGEEAAPEGDFGVEPPLLESPPVDPLSADPFLSPELPECEDSWDEQLDALPEAQRGWVSSISHRVYHVRVEGQVIARLELMSAVSPKACDLESDWSLRHNTLLVSYFPVNGEVEEVQYDFSPDEDFMAETVDVQASEGSIVLLGSNFGGEQLMMELDLDRLRAIYADVVQDVPEGRSVLTV